MKLLLNQKFMLNTFLKTLTQEENVLKAIITDILSEDDNAQAAAIKTLCDICNYKNSKSVNATFLLGFTHYYGIGIDKDSAQAFKIFEAIKNVSVYAQTMLGLIYVTGDKINNKDCKKAFEFLQLAADQGNATAQCTLGAMYVNGEGVNKDYKKAFEYYTLSADQGSAAAQCNLGFMYEAGRWVDQDNRKAFEFFKLAAEQGHARAQGYLGFIYAIGQGVDKDDERACQLYRLAADQGNAEAQFNLGFMYEAGRGVGKDDERACQLYKLAADQGNAAAQCNLGIMYANGRGVSKDNKKALEFFQRYYEAIGNLEQVQFIYAESPDVIPGLGADRTKAVLLALSMLQQNENIGLREKLAKLYNENPSYPRDLKSALDAYNSEAQSDISNLLEKEHEVALQKKRTAFDRLGFCHQFGIGSPKDLKLASECYQEAIELGSTISYHQLYFCYHQGLKSVFTLEELIGSFQNYAKKNNMEAIIILARIYEHGLENLPSDQSVAFFYYQKAHGMVKECPHEEGRKESIAQKIKALTPLNDPTETIAGVFFSFGRPLPKPVSDLIAQYAFEVQVSTAGNSSNNAVPKRGAT